MVSFSLSAPISDGYEAMTKKDLLAVASELGIEGLNDKMLKADIIAALRGEG